MDSPADTKDSTTPSSSSSSNTPAAPNPSTGGLVGNASSISAALSNTVPGVDDGEVEDFGSSSTSKSILLQKPRRTKKFSISQERTQISSIVQKTEGTGTFLVKFLTYFVKYKGSQ